MEIDEKNVNYLVNKCRQLEDSIQKYMLEIKEKDQHIKDLEIEYLQQAGVIYDQEKENAAEMEREIQDDLAQEFMYGHPYSNTDDPEYPDDPRDYPEEQYE